MTKTCYFCEKFYLFNCTNPKHNHCNQACDDNFTPNADWLEYESLKKENEELKNLKDITKSFAERCRIIFTQSENIPPSIRSEYLKHTQYEYEEIKRLIDGLDEVKE
jgi:hypothetical protein